MYTYICPCSSSSIVVGINKCCITLTYRTVPCLIDSSIATACVKRYKTERFQIIAACVTSENHERCLKGYHSNLLRTISILNSMKC